jgi:hypothetical protein
MALVIATVSLILSGVENWICNADKTWGGIVRFLSIEEVYIYYQSIGIEAQN